MDFFDVVENRRSIRKYLEKEVEKEKLQKILEVARLSPSAKNLQPYQIFVVATKDLKSKIYSACNQEWKAPIMIAVVCNPKQAWVRDDGEEYWKTDAAVAMHQISLAAWAEGLGTCWIAAFKENQVKEILGVPSDSRVAFLSPLGYPAEMKGPIEKRKSLDSLVRYK